MRPSEVYVSAQFNMDDIRRIRDDNSARHLQLSPKEMLEDINKGANEFLAKLSASKLTHPMDHLS